MNKTVTINISGIIFHIDEDAFEKLSKYLGTIRSYLKDSDGCDEIMTDIESRIAEMLQEKVSATKQVVLMNDVDHVISVMGKPEEFALGESELFHTEEKTIRDKEPAKKRVFRDPDDKVLGGVCSGIGAYFGIDPVWLRLAFALVFFVWGTGLLVYILLWIIIPKAVTSAQKLEMRGESVNIDNIKKTIEDGATQLKSKPKNFESEIKEFNSQRAGSGARAIFEKTGGFLSSIFTWVFRTIARILGFVLILIGLPLLFLAVCIFSSSFLVSKLSLGLILLIGIPLLAMIYGGFKLLLQIKKSNRMFNLFLLCLWLLGIGISIVCGYQFASDFSVKEKSSRILKLQQPKGATLYISSKTDSEIRNNTGVNTFGFYNGKWSGSFITNSFFIVDKDEKSVMGYPHLNIIPSETDSFEMELTKWARGKTGKEASIRADNINYEFSQKDSSIELNSYFDINNMKAWRNQKVNIVIKVPKNKVVYLDESLIKMLYDVDNVSKTFDKDMVGHKWIMREGGLTCVDCSFSH